MEERNDALTSDIDCKIQDKCCDKPNYKHMMGMKECICFNCQHRCRKCNEDWNFQRTAIRN
jgi:hypothetical protein